jgi:cobaltochelatase CobT subunit
MSTQATISISDILSSTLRTMGKDEQAIIQFVEGLHECTWADQHLLLAPSIETTPLLQLRGKIDQAIARRLFHQKQFFSDQLAPHNLSPNLYALIEEWESARIAWQLAKIYPGTATHYEAIRLPHLMNISCFWDHQAASPHHHITLLPWLWLMEQGQMPLSIIATDWYHIHRPYYLLHCHDVFLQLTLAVTDQENFVTIWLKYRSLWSKLLGEQQNATQNISEELSFNNVPSSTQETLDDISQEESALDEKEIKEESISESTINQTVSSSLMGSGGIQEAVQDPLEEEFNSTKPESGNTDPSASSTREAFYHPYTTLFDEIVDAGSLSNQKELDQLRRQLDQRLEKLAHFTHRLAHRLQRKLMAKQIRHWELQQEEGILDTSRLVQWVIDPNYRLIYKWEHASEYIHSTVTLLLDNSGSMRGRPIMVAALCADILAATLERCGIKVEILGFTTKEWKGGKSFLEWKKADRPTNPGRLNDLRHIIYKHANQPWRRTKKQLGLMLKDGILKENIDGEAILWAHDRLIKRLEKRKILMVISDGAPVDDTTTTHNNPHYLEQHLRYVIKKIESHQLVQLLAIGIGHDVTRYYKQAITIKDVEQLGGTMFDAIANLL